MKITNNYMHLILKRTLRVLLTFPTYGGDGPLIIKKCPY